MVVLGRCCLLALLCLPLSTLLATGESGLTLSGRIDAFFAAQTRGDAAAAREFILENYSASALQERPLAERVPNLLRLWGDLGKAAPLRAEVSDSGVTWVTAQNPSGDTWRIGFLDDGSAEHKLIGLRLLMGEPPADSPQANAITEKAALDSVRKLLSDLTDRDQFSGVVLIARQGEPILHEAFGFADRTFSVPNRGNTKFNLGSINKDFTQIAIEQLAASGKLSLDDPLGKYLPDYPNAAAKNKVTIRHLLSHSGGIGDFFGDKYEATPKDRIRTLRDYIPLFSSEPLSFEPGTRQEYSNGGYVLLGAIIESVTGESYYDYVKERIFDPAGMTDTDYFEADHIVPNLATGYTRNWGGQPSTELRSNFYTRPARGSSAGGGYSTAPDLLKFVNAAESGRIPGAHGGLGIAGGAPGLNAALESGIGNGYTAIILSNLDPPSAESPMQKIVRWLNRCRLEQ